MDDKGLVGLGCDQRVVIIHTSGHCGERLDKGVPGQLTRLTNGGFNKLDLHLITNPAHPTPFNHTVMPTSVGVRSYARQGQIDPFQGHSGQGEGRKSHTGSLGQWLKSNDTWSYIRVGWG